MTRIELALSAWKAEALPLSYIRVPVGNEHHNNANKSDVQNRRAPEHHMKQLHTMWGQSSAFYQFNMGQPFSFVS